MTAVAPGDETAATPHDVPADPSQVAGESPSVPRDTSVQLAYLHGGHVSHSWHQSMMNLLAYDKTVGSNAILSMPFAVSCSGPNSLPEGRNMAVTHFLDQTEHDWLFFTDTDMGFKPESLDRLLVAADPVSRPVVGGLCFALKHMSPDGQGGYVVRPMPTLYSWAEHAEQGIGFANRFRYPPETLVHVAGTGAAFLLIHRSVLEDIRVLELAKDVSAGRIKPNGDRWFDMRTYDDGTQVSEDLSFCWRVGESGKRVFVHTGVKVTHHKEVWLGEDAYQMPEKEPMGHMMIGGGESTLGHAGSDRWTGGDRKDEP